MLPEADTLGAPTHHTPGTSAAVRPAVLRAAAGAFLVVVGAGLLLEQLVPGLSRFTWPAALMLVGAAVIFTGGRR